MIEMAEGQETGIGQVAEALEHSTRGKKRGRPKAKKAASTTRQPARIGVELPDTVTLELAEYCAAHPLVNASALRAIVREAARTAALGAVDGKVAEIAKAAIGA